MWNLMQKESRPVGNWEILFWINQWFTVYDYLKVVKKNKNTIPLVKCVLKVHFLTNWECINKYSLVQYLKFRAMTKLQKRKTTLSDTMCITFEICLNKLNCKHTLYLHIA